MIVATRGGRNGLRATNKTDCRHVTQPAAYLDAIHDAIAVIEDRAQLAGAASGERLLLRVIVSELRSLHPAGRAPREQTRADKLQTIVDEFAASIVTAAAADIDYASQRADSMGHVCATVTLSFPATCRWLRYAAQRSNNDARRLLKYIAAQRAPSIPGDPPPAPP